MGKVCRKCKVEKDETNFFNSKTSKDGLNNQCKECKRLYTLNRNDNLKIISVDHKLCITCKELKSSNQFNKCCSTKDGLSRYCKGCSLKKSQEFTHKNNDQIKERMRHYRKLNSDKLNAQRERYKKLNREKLKLQRKKYKNTCIEKTRESNRKSSKNLSTNLSDSYIKKLLIENHGWTKEMIESNPGILELQREIIKFKRKLNVKNRKTS